MKAITLSILMLALAIPGFTQTPAAPTGPAVQPQTAPPAQPANPPATTPAPPAGSPVPVASSKIVVPADTTIPLILENTINTKSAFVGQAIYCESIYPITVGNRIIIPKGSSVRGTVTEVVRPGRVKGRAQLGFRFDELILPNGTTRHLRATLAGFGSTGDDKFKPKEGQVEGGGSKGKDAETVARTTIPGAEIGTIVGAAKGAPLEGLGIGSAAGAATGLIWILATRGKEVVLAYGTNLDLQLSQPVTFDHEELDPPSHYDAGPAIPRREYGPRN
ncbi:MAG: hypothetical protein ACLQVL_16155 [Terriglobia bacterium]